jgi:predicted Zn-dependent peptidase
MGNLLPAMTQAKLDTQRDVVKNERRWRIDNQPYGDWDERIQEMMYPRDHPYHHSVIGSMADLDAASLEDVAEFFRTYYAPNNAVLTICGDYDREHAGLLVDRYFGRIPSGPPVPPIPGQGRLPAVLGGEVRQSVQQDISLSRLYLAYRTPAYGESGFHAAAVSAFILAWGKASLLYRNLVRRRAVLQDVTAYAFPVVVGASMLVLWTTARPGEAPETIESEVFANVASLKEVTPEDVERAKNLMESRQLSELQRVDERADQLSMHTTLFGDPGRINTEMERIRRVSAEDIRAFAGAFLNEDNRAVLWYVPNGGTAG